MVLNNVFTMRVFSVCFMLPNLMDETGCYLKGGVDVVSFCAPYQEPIHVVSQPNMVYLSAVIWK